MRTFLMALLAVLMASCAQPVVRTVTSTPTLTDWALKAKIEQAGERVGGKTLIVFVHGMGDHCPGYALDRRIGWFSEGVTSLLGLAKPSHDPTPVMIPDFENGDPASFLVMRKYEYAYPDGSHPVDAVEITWSGLTRWLKNKQLAYDLSDPTKKSGPADTLRRGDDIRDCIDVVGGQYDQPRVPINKALKDGLLDRNLADAVIYVGSYGPKIERETADALCRIFQGDWADVRHAPDGKPVRCTWPAVPTLPYTNVLFVTHSLGSRIVYDTMLELSNTRMRPDSEVLKPDVIAAAEPTIKRVMDNATSMYMMANQLPLLGLASAKPTQSSADDPVRLLEIFESSRIEGVQFDRSGQNSALSRASESTLARSDPLFKLASLRGPAAKPLDIVAFNDANDLLSYSVPNWYAGLAGFATVNVTNVYVRNATRWFWLVENPSAAHTGYMSNDNAWRTIACGANERGAVSTCTQTTKTP